MKTVSLTVEMPEFVRTKLDRLRQRAGAESLDDLFSAMAAAYDLGLRCEEEGGTVYLVTPEDGDERVDTLRFSFQDESQELRFARLLDIFREDT